MQLEDLNVEYDKLQKKYGAKELDFIYNGGCKDNPILYIIQLGTVDLILINQ